MSDRKGDCMQTFSGVRFWPLDPRPEEVNMGDIAHGLSMICRFGGHCTKFYSVAQHSVLLSDHVPEEMALWALLDDASETYVGDMIRPLKLFIPQYKAIETGVQNAVYEAFGLNPADKPAGLKAYDNRILIDERRYLMFQTGDTWDHRGESEGLGLHIVPLPPHEAKNLFLRRFYELLR